MFVVTAPVPLGLVAKRRISVGTRARASVDNRKWKQRGVRIFALTLCTERSLLSSCARFAVRCSASGFPAYPSRG